MRLLIIAWRLTPIVVSFRRDVARWLWFGAPMPRTPEFHARRARNIVRAVAALGPTFIKMAQLLGARTDVIPEPYVGALASLMDRVPATSWPIMACVIERAYGKPITAVFDSFADVPLASASLGQVYEAHVNGRKVAVKVMRPGVEQLIQADCAASRRILFVLERLFRGNRRVLRAVRQFRVILEEFAFRVRDETDYRLEAANAVEVRENFVDSPGIRVPEVLLSLVKQRVLVMEFMEGDAVDALDARVADGSVDVSQIVPRLIEAYTSMMMIDGLFHADPHPKNLMIAPDGALVLLDFGMVVRVSRATRRALLDTIMSAIRKDIDGLIDGFDALGLRDPDATKEELRPIVMLLVKSASQYATTQERMDLLSDQVMESLYDKPPVTVPSTMVYFARTASLIEGLATRYDPRFNPIAIATPVMLRLQPAILAALGRIHNATPADWMATVTTVMGDGLDVVSSRLGFTQPGQLARLGGRLARQVRSLINGERTEPRLNGGPPRLQKGGE